MSAAFYPAAIVVGWTVVSLGGVASPRVEASRAAHVVEHLAPSLAANAELPAAPQKAATQTTAAGYVAAVDADVATPAEFIAKPVPDTPPVPETPTASDEPQQPIVVAALTDPAEILPTEVPAEQTASASTAAPLPQEGVGTVPRRIEIVGDCLVVEPCIDQYLLALYERTPKEDTIKETERRKVTVKRKGKLVTVTRSFTRLVDNDFTWRTRRRQNARACRCSTT